MSFVILFIRGAYAVIDPRPFRVAAPRVSALRAVAMCVVIGLGAAACSESDPAPATAISNDPYISLRVNVHTAVMSTVAPYDTLQLVATPYKGKGGVLQTTGSVRYLLNDTSVSVSASGLVRAHSVTSGTYIISALQDPATNVTHIDTTFIVVTNQVPASPLQGYALLPFPGDSAKLGVFGNTIPVDTAIVSATDGGGGDLTSSVVTYFESSDANVAAVDQSGFITGVRSGQAYVVASTTYYGVTKRDSVLMTVGNPIFVQVALTRIPGKVNDSTPMYGFSPSSITIGVGGTIEFYPPFLAGGADHVVLDVVFDDPSAAQPSPLPLTVAQAATGSGNIDPIPVPIIDNILVDCFDFDHFEYGPFKCAATRAFPVTGTYHYHSAYYGTSGTIVVRDP